MADWHAEGMVGATLYENEQLYSREEVNQAKQAYQLIKNCGYPSAGEVANILMDGNVHQG